MGASTSTAASSTVATSTAVSSTVATSTAAECAGMLGMSTVTLAGGAVVLIVVVGIGIWIYTRKSRTSNSDSPIIQQASTQQPLNEQQMNPNYAGPNIPKFKKITMTQSEFDQLVVLTEQRYKQRVQKFVCPISFKVMVQPCQMKCCKDKIEKSDRWAEKSILEFYIENRKKCILCYSDADENSILLDQDLYDAILGFRMRMVKTYKESKQKGKWKELIDNEFGDGYTAEHLENFKPV